MKVFLSVVCASFLCFACDERPVLAPTPAAPSLVALFLSFSGGGTNSEGELPVGRTVQFRAFARFSDGTGQNVAADAVTWQSADTNIATVSSTGVVEGVSPGIAGITATLNGVGGNLNVVVVP